MGWRDFLHRAEDTEGDLVASSKKSKLFLVDFGRTIGRYVGTSKVKSSSSLPSWDVSHSLERASERARKPFENVKVISENQF